MLARALVFILAVGFAMTAAAQNRQQIEDDAKSTPVEMDLSFDYDPEELREHLPPRVQFKRIWGPIGIAGYHVPPAAEPGPYRGPPQTIWSNGFGTSLWRDPVTGWPLQ
jgi:hypothetical protein